MYDVLCKLLSFLLVGGLICDLLIKLLDDFLWDEAGDLLDVGFCEVAFAEPAGGLKHHDALTEVAVGDVDELLDGAWAET